MSEKYPVLGRDLTEQEKDELAKLPKIIALLRGLGVELPHSPTIGEILEKWNANKHRLNN